jgi:dienelactone hydrolase
MLKKNISYQSENVTLQGFAAYDDQDTHKRPAVIVAHDWTGRNQFACDKAEKLAALGYVGFALDMFGDAKLGSNKEEKTQLIKPLMENRALLQQRMLAAVNTVKNIAVVDTHHIAAIGFCFGGLCVLDLARTGTDICGVVSFHGLLVPPQDLPAKQVKAKVLAMHGNDDPMVPTDHVIAFEKEMTAAKTDWQLHVYGNTMHGFTNPVANDPGFGTVYNTLADKRSWLAMQNFLTEIFG